MEHLLQKHHRGVALIDSNLLLLYLVGTCDPRIIGRFTRTRSYTVDDFHLLNRLLRQYFSQLVTTPNILTEVSNLATKLSENERQLFLETMKQEIVVLSERYCESTVAANDPLFRRFGLTDSGILHSCSALLVITDDVALYSAISQRGYDVINFTHLRVLAGNFR